MNRAHVLSPIVAAALLAPLAPHAAAQFAPTIQERSAQTTASVTSGSSDSDFAEATDFGLFTPTLTSLVTGPGGANASAGASQSSSFSSALISGALSSSVSAATGSTFVVGESDAASSLLFIFSIAAPTQVLFSASGSMSFLGTNPDGEPSDLYGAARVSLVDADTLDPVAAFSLFGADGGSDSASFIGTLSAGSYAIQALASTHIYSADLLGPPPRSGSGSSGVSFSLAVVPTPGSALLLGVGTLTLSRRRTL